MSCANAGHTLIDKTRTVMLTPCDTPQRALCYIEKWVFQCKDLYGVTIDNRERMIKHFLNACNRINKALFNNKMLWVCQTNSSWVHINTVYTIKASSHEFLRGPKSLAIRSFIKKLVHTNKKESISDYWIPFSNGQACGNRFHVMSPSCARILRNIKNVWGKCLLPNLFL